FQPGDYIIASGAVIFPAGSVNGATQTIIVDITDDLIGEPTENYHVNLSNIVSTGSASISDALGIGTILDNDPVTLTLSGFTTTETNSTQTQNFAVTLNRAAQEDIVIAFTTTNNSALAGSDYTAQSLVSYTILAGSTFINIPVDVLGDLMVEPTENFIGTITLVNANNQNVFITVPNSNGIILDDDPDISILKTGVWNDANNNGFPDAGETITYKFKVINTGSVTLNNIIVTDPILTIIGGPLASLAAGAIDSTTFAGTFLIMQSNIETGQVINT